MKRPLKFAFLALLVAEAIGLCQAASEENRDRRCIDQGQNHVVVTGRDGSVWAVGSNAHGQLGRDTGTHPDSVLRMVRGFGRARSVHSGSTWSLALLEDGTIWTWGENQVRFARRGGRKASTMPVKVGGIEDAVQVDIAHRDTIALLSGGAVMTWSEPSGVPRRVRGLAGVRHVAAAELGGERGAFFAVLADGTAKMWGDLPCGLMTCGKRQYPRGAPWPGIDQLLEAVPNRRPADDGGPRQAFGRTPGPLDVPGLSGARKLIFPWALLKDGRLLGWDMPTERWLPVEGLSDVVDVGAGRVELADGSVRTLATGFPVVAGVTPLAAISRTFAVQPEGYVQRYGSSFIVQGLSEAGCPGSSAPEPAKGASER